MGENRWIVLIDKTPRGPLSESDVRLLIEQKIVRFNDLASQIVPKIEGKKAEWKFLWQYPEFDRRSEPSFQSKEVLQDLSFHKKERRENLSNSNLEEKKKDLLPEELNGINPEDLVYHSTTFQTTASQNQTERNSFEDSASVSPSSPIFSQSLWLHWKTLAGSAMILVLGSTFYFLTLSDKTVSKDSAMSKKVMPNVETTQELQIEKVISVSSPLSTVSLPEKEAVRPVGPIAKEIKKEATPPSNEKEVSRKTASDRGDISYEEYRRRQDEDLDVAVSPEEDRLNEDDLFTEDPQEEEISMKKKKKKRAKQRLVLPESDEDTVDSSEQHFDEE